MSWTRLAPAGVLILALLGPAQAAAETATLQPSSAGGWSEADGALQDAGSASTSASGEDLVVGGFGPPGTGNVSSVTLRIDTSQVDHSDDALLVSASAPGCSVTASPVRIEPSGTRATHAIALSCTEGWSWPAIEGLTVTLTSEAAGGLLLLSGVDGDWHVHHVRLDAAFVPPAAPPEPAEPAPAETTPAEPAPVATPAPADPADPFPWWVLGVVAAVLLAAVLLLRRRKTEPHAPRPRLVLGDMDAALRNEELVQFMNNASHDLAGPLTPIRLQLSLLNRGHGDALTEKQKHALDVVKRNVEHMGLLVTDLKDAARLQAGRLDLYKEPMDLGRTVREACESFQAPCHEKGVRLDFHHDGEVPIEGDAGRLTQVMYNLINNALKFTDKGSIQVGVHQTEDGRAAVTVRDTGIGMSDEDAGRLFQPFSQAHDAVQKKKGSGLGLFICKGIVEGHGGEIWCESPGPGEGSVFAFTLPLDHAAKVHEAPPLATVP